METNDTQFLQLRHKNANLELTLANQTTSYNKEVIELQECNTKLRASFEKNELRRRKLEYELSVVHKDLNEQIRNKAKEDEIKKNELDNLKDEFSIMAQDLQSTKSLLDDQKVLFEEETGRLLNEVKLYKDDNEILKKENDSKILDWKNESDKLNKKYAVLEDELEKKGVEVEYSEGIINDQNILFEKEKEIMSDEIKLHKGSIAELKEENYKVVINWKNKFNELNKQCNEVRGELSEKASDIESTKSLLHEQKMVFDEERETLLNEIKHCEVNIADLEKQKDQEILNWKNRYDELNEKCTLLEGQQIKHSATINKLLNDNQSISNNEQELMEKNMDLKEQIKTLVGNIEAERATHLQTKFNTEILQLKLHTTEKELAAQMVSSKECKNNLEEAEQKYQNLECISSSDKAMNSELYEQSEKRNQELEKEYELQSEELADKIILLSNISIKINKCEEELNNVKEKLKETKSRLASSESSKNVILKGMKLLMKNYNSSDKKDEWTLDSIVEVIRQTLKDFKARVEISENKLQAAQSSLEKLTIEYETQKEVMKDQDKALQEAETLVKNAQYSFSASELKSSTYKECITKLEMERHHLDSQVNKVEDELSCMTEELQRHKQALMKLRQLNAELLSQTEKRLVDAQKNWLCEKQKLEELLNQRLDEQKADFNEMESHRNDALEKYTAIQISLKESKTLNDLLNNNLQQSEHEKKCIIATIAVIAGAFWALVLRHESLCVEKAILVNIARPLFKLKENMLQLNSTINYEISKIDKEVFKEKVCHTLSGIFRFRVAVIAVLGVIRFYKVALYTKSIRSTQKLCSCHHNLLFYGTSRHNNRQKKEKKSASKTLPSILSKEKELSIWLHNDDVLKDICLNAATPLVSLVKNEDNVTSKETEYDGSLIKTTCNCYTSFLESIKVEMEDSSLFLLQFCGKRNSLVYHLGLGLKRLLTRESNSQHLYLPVSQVTSTLNESIVGVTRKLNSIESIKADCDHYKEERDQLKSEVCCHIAQVKETDRTLKAQIYALEMQIKESISDEQFNEVCFNLDESLKREDSLQTLLKEQTNQIYEITARIEKQEEEATNLFTKKYKIYQQDISRLQLKMEELKDKLLQLEQEKEGLNILLQEEHKKMGQYSLEKELLVQYLNAVSSLICNSMKDTGLSSDHLNKISTLLPDTVLPENLLALDGKSITPGMLICQNTVQSFVKVHNRTLQCIIDLRNEREILKTKMISLEEDAKSHRLNVQKLKQQISKLCH